MASVLHPACCFKEASSFVITNKIRPQSQSLLHEG